MLKSLPVLMYHYVSAWPNAIAVDPEVFESHLQAMSEGGFRGVGLSEAASYFMEGRALPEKSALITFDDGFLDNFVYAYPLLKKYGHKGIIFAVTGKITDQDLVRPTLDDVWSGFVGVDELPQVNRPYHSGAQGFRIRRDLFFSWEEAKAMEASGVVRVEAHSHRHRSVFTGPGFETFFKPGDRKRTFDRMEAEVLFGLPAFEHGPALARKAFYPSDEIYGLVRDTVPQDFDGAKAFFDRPGAAADLEKRILNIPREERGRIETGEEFEERVRGEIKQCRDALATHLGRKPLTFSWPWGEYCEKSLEIAKELGFSLFFTTTMGPNPPGKNPSHIHRFKAKNKKPAWLISRLGIYSRPLVAKVYGKLHA